MKLIGENLPELELGNKFSDRIPKTMIKDKIDKLNFIIILEICSVKV